MPRSAPQTLESCRLLLCGVVGVVGLIVVVGWVLDISIIKSGLTGFTTMKFNTALGLVLAACGLAASSDRAPRKATWPLGAGLIALALATLAEYATGRTLGIDQLVIADSLTTSMPYPGRMAPASALALLACGAAIFLLGRPGWRWSIGAAHTLAVVPASVAYFSLVGYAYGLKANYRFGPFESVAVHTAASLGCLAAAILLTSPRQGWAGIYDERPIALDGLIRLAALSMLLPFVGGLLITVGTRLDLYRPQSDPALFTLAAAAIGIVLVLSASLTIRQAEAAMLAADAERLRQQAALRVSQANQSVLLGLVQGQREVTAPARMMEDACKALGESLDAHRVGFYEVIEDDRMAFTAAWANGRMEKLAESCPMSAISRGSLARLRRGESVALDDISTDPQIASGVFAGLGIRAAIGVAIHRAGAWRAGLYVHQMQPRHWSHEEVGLARDVAEQSWDAVTRAQAVMGLAESEAFTRLLLDSTSEGFYSVDRDGVTTLCNDAFIRMLGFKGRGDVIGQRLHGRIHHTHPDGRPHPVADCPIYRAASSGQPAHVIDDVFFRTDGTELPVDYSAEPIWQNGELRGAICTFTDITERRRDRDALRRLNETLELQVEQRTRERDRLWELSEDLLVVADYEGWLKRVSPSWTRVLGWSEAVLMEHSYGRLLHPEEQEAIAGILRTMQASGQSVSFETRMRTADDDWRWLAWRLTPEPGGERLNGIGRDVTVARQQAEALAQAEETLRQSQKMEAVGQLTGGLAHDFNNLLTGIAGSLELMQSRIGQGRIADLDRYIVAAQGAARRAASLTHRLLAFSRRQTLDPRPTDVNRLVSGMEELIRRTVGPAVALEVIGAGGLWTSMIDAGQLENALLNLCINARDAMPDGGRLTIETANKWLDERAAQERDLPAGQYLSICVTDTGAGMPQEVIARAFEPFFTTKPLGMGTGLGLSMVYGFARQSGGQVRIYSEPASGATICIYLPRHRGEADAEMTMASAGEQPAALPGKTVLVVDDEPTIRMLVTEVLSGMGIATIEAADGPSGLKALQSAARIDLLLTDVGLPGGMNGRQLADAARVARPALKVLFVTGYADNAVVGNGHLAAGMQIMTKPFAMDELATRVSRLIADA